MYNHQLYERIQSEYALFHLAANCNDFLNRGKVNQLLEAKKASMYSKFEKNTDPRLVVGYCGLLMQLSYQLLDLKQANNFAERIIRADKDSLPVESALLKNAEKIRMIYGASSWLPADPPPFELLLHKD